MRAQKIEEFKNSERYRVLGESIDEKRWIYNNKDDEKKAIVKQFDSKICKELGLDPSEPVDTSII